MARRSSTTFPGSRSLLSLPDYLARHLREDRHLTDDAIAATSQAEAQRLLNAWYSRDREG